MSSMKLVRYVHTLRYLRLKQVVFRLYDACRTISLKPMEVQKLRRWEKNGIWPSAYIPSISNKREFKFSGEAGCLNDINIWNDPARSKLWLYNLHYLNELNSIGVEDCSEVVISLIDQWIKGNPPVKGNGWEPYPLSLRIVNLVKWFSAQKGLIDSAWLDSLGMQAVALNKQVEYHILGNHLFANGKALVFVGAYFDGSYATRWLTKGLKLLDREIQEQFLKDGAHFELSPMYHACLLWDMCDLVNLANQSGLPELLLRKQQWEGIIERALNWLLVMLHPDGGIPFFNDAAFGVAPEFTYIKNYAELLGIKLPNCSNDQLCLQWLKESGYCVVNLDNSSKAIMDLAKVGPDYQPGHAHADTLSFELSVHGHRFLVNSGVSHYAENNLRLYQRSTKAHNTVMIDGSDSSEVWGGFRVARRAYPKNILIREESTQIMVGCSHDGYLRLPGRPVHRREWTYTRNSLMIRDMIAGQFEEAEVRYYLHPDVIITSKKEDGIECKFPAGSVMAINVLNTKSLIVESTNWYPMFGYEIPNYCVVIKFKTNELLTQIKW